jgi:RNA polymerase sigma factor (TIGR02999 family)
MVEAQACARTITALLHRWQEGDGDARERLIPLVYTELHRMAARYLARERGGHTLQSTALVHEAYLKLVDQSRVGWQSRSHFFGLAAQMMRRILVDHARRARRLKRGSGVARVQLDEVRAAGAARVADPVDALTMDHALRELETIDTRQARIVELRFYAGLTVEEAAEVLELSPATVKREWAMARAWLYRRVAPPAAGRDETLKD